MMTPEEKIRIWKRDIKKAKSKNELELIKYELDIDKEFIEEWLREYDNMIEEIEDKLVEEDLK